MCVIRIGGEEYEFLAIKLLGRSYPERTDSFGNLVSATLEIAAGEFSACVVGELRSDELEWFLRDLSILEETLNGTVQFLPTEDWLRFTFGGDGRGHIALKGEAIDHCGNTLAYNIQFDQTSLGRFVAQLRNALLHFPVVYVEH